MTNQLEIQNQQGFVALISVIIITIVLVVISISVSTTSFFSRFNVADIEYKKRSSDLAEACVDSALLKIAQDPSYTPAAGGEIVNVGSDTCKIFTVVTVGSQITIQTKAIYQKAVTNLQVTVDSGSYSLISWQELPTL